VVGVEPSSPAAQAGLREGDILINFKGKALGSIDDLHRLLVGVEIGARNSVKLVRGVELLEFHITPVELVSQSS
jgi:serine protease Do